MVQHSRLNPRLKPLPAVVLLVALIVPVLVYATSSQRRYSQSLYSMYSGTAAISFAEMMQKRAKEEGTQFTEGMSVVEIADGESWGCCSYNLDDIIVEIAGEAPAYEGTVIRCKAHKLDGSGVLIVSNLSNSKWTVEYPEVPPWWMVWK
ncbi:MAG: hypothetical protein K8I27_17345 [Planctomycetes bacterium]|nr:hypothetical protein [Planctomycetota bacterium]